MRKRLIIIIMMVSQGQTLANVQTVLAMGAQGWERWERGHRRSVQPWNQRRIQCGTWVCVLAGH